MDWPVPDKTAQAHSERLIEHLRQRLDAAGGWIGFAEYLQEALYAPGLGYYSGGAAKFGEAGDFVTAPEVSPLFGRCLAAQVKEVLQRIDGDTVVEIGGGGGALAADLIGEFPPAKYRIVEVSADLRERQARTLRATGVAVDWPDGPQDIAPFRGVILGNEIIDALPFERFRIAGGRVESLGVTWNGSAFCDAARPAGEALTAAVREVEEAIGAPLPDGYVSEVRPRLREFVAQWAGTLDRGAMIWIDYGCSRREYYSPQRNRGTMMCHYRHRAHADPYVYPGLQDIGAWVDFTALVEAGAAAGLELAGYATQSHFLIGCGIDQRFDEMRRSARNELESLALNEQLRRLMLPAEMGERFRVMALTRGLDGELLGFSFRDLSASL